MTAAPHPPGFVEGEWCHVHRVHEPGDGYRRCFECGHLWATGRATRWQTVKARIMGWWDYQTLTPARVYFCPLCLHDF
jgi:hypothetical protein